MDKSQLTQDATLESCPVCKCSGHVQRYAIVNFSIRDWPLILLLIGVTMIVGGLLSLGANEIFLFAALSIIPACIHLLKRSFCHGCGADFKIEQE